MLNLKKLKKSFIISYILFFILLFILTFISYLFMINNNILCILLRICLFISIFINGYIYNKKNNKNIKEGLILCIINLSIILLLNFFINHNLLSINYIITIISNLLGYEVKAYL